MHNFKCVTEENAAFKFKDRQNRILDFSSQNIDLQGKVDFATEIKPLVDEKKLEYIDKIKSLQAEFNDIEAKMCQERLEQERTD